MIQNRSLSLLCLAAAWSLALTGASFASGRFALEQTPDGKFWFVDAENPGEPFVSLGVNHIVPVHDFMAPPDTTYYNAVERQFDGDFEAWAADARRILKHAGFNTIGAWSDPKLNDGSLYETPILYVISAEPNRVTTILDPQLEERMTRNVRKVFADLVHPEQVLGVFLDNEMAWYGVSPWTPLDYHTVLEEYLALPADSLHRGEAMKWLKARYDGDAKAFAEAWKIEMVDWDDLTDALAKSTTSEGALADRAAFTEMVAELFYSTARRVMDRERPGTLLLGTRFAGTAPKPVVEICGRYCDVVSFNNYRGSSREDWRLIARYWIEGGRKPLMITEFSWRAEQNTSGNPNKAARARWCKPRPSAAPAMMTSCRTTWHGR
ncbi:MAG: hypothetical protein RLY93_01625 [Sumerlaeia bacterium]